MNVKHTRSSDITPWRELEDLPHRFARMFRDPVWFDSLNQPSAFVPSVDIAETDTELTIKVELAGMKKDDVDIEIEDNVLTIKGEKKEEKEEKQPHMHMWERRYGSFERAFTLPRGVAADRVKAEFHDGLLTIHMPKAAEVKGKKVEIGT